MISFMTVEKKKKKNYRFKTVQWLPAAQAGEKDWLHQGELEGSGGGGIETVTYLDCDGYTTICQKSQNCILKRVNWTLCKCILIKKF